MTMPALALVGASGRIHHSTEPFRARCPRAAELCEELPELDAVISGQADQAIVSLDEVEAKVEAVVDSTGSRCLLMTLVAEPGPADGDAENAILREALDDSPAIVWLKDLEGRHMRVNRQFVAVLGGSEELIKGRTDAELPTTGTIDGPRLQDAERSTSEPVEFEYTVPAYQDRPALAAVRFRVQGRDGEPVAVCGVAAPLAHAEIAHTEAARLMRLDRWRWLDSESIRGELLEDWGVKFGAAADDDDTMLSGFDPDDEWGTETAADGGAGHGMPLPEHRPQADWEGEIAAAVAAREEAVSARAALEQRLSALEKELAQARSAPEPAQVNADGDAAEAIAAARSEADAARNVAQAALAEAEATRTAVEAAQRETEAARRETQATRADVEAARSEAQAVRAELGTAHAAAESARAEAQAAWAEADAERTNASTLAGQLADARRQLQHQRARVALAQQQLEIPRCTAAAQASRPAAQKPQRGGGAPIPLRARQPAAQPLDPTVMSQPAPQELAGAPASAPHGVAPHSPMPQEPRGLLGRFRSRRRR